MLSNTRHLAAAAARRASLPSALKIATGTIATTTLATTIYINTDNGLGLKREINFWSSVTPVFWDYWWNSFASSPKVIWSKKQKELLASYDDDSKTQEQEEKDEKERRKELLNQLHERNAPKIYNAMLSLGGLYIKLGQVLSVTALPIPEAYRKYFRKLQSSVPNHEDFISVVKPTLEYELGKPLYEVFDTFHEVPCGAASIGQAHKATLKHNPSEEVIVKVQYPNAKWQIPADIECVGQFLQLCVYLGLIDESSSKLSYEEFARQFLSELDYTNEMENLKSVHASSIDPTAPYIKHGVVLPRVYEELCTDQVITMSFIPGRKFEEETKRQLRLLGIDTDKRRSIHSIIKESADVDDNGGNDDESQKRSSGERASEMSSSHALALSSKQTTSMWKMKLSNMARNLISVDMVFSVVRFSRRIALWSQGITVKWIQLASSLHIVPAGWKTWADERQNDILQSLTLDWTEDAVHTLLDVHGYQILNQGLFSE
jgi:hypothetical protein